MFRADSLSKELVVAREILLAERENDTPVYFNKLVDRLTKKNLASRATVSRYLDALFDQGIVKAEWTKTPEGNHVRSLQIAGEARKFVEAIDQAVTE